MDRISRLSDDLLIRILKSLDETKHVLATSCLSKRWQHLWSLVPKLVCQDCSHDDSDGEYPKFTQFVYRSLLSNKAPVLESLYLALGHKCRAVDIGIWIDIAVARHLHSLKFTTNDFLVPVDPISLPSSVYTCETLETLKLVRSIRLNIPSSVRLPSLKRLHLQDVHYCKDKRSLARLISGCPKLERLDLKQDKLLDVILLVPCLKKLRMLNEKRDYEKGSGFVIDAPSLEYFDVLDYVHYDFLRIEHMPKLKSAYLTMTHGVDHKFLNAFTNVRVFNLGLPYKSEIRTIIFRKVPSSSGMIFHNLSDLELSTWAQGWWDLLSHMLQASPKLKRLSLNAERDDGVSGVETPDCWKQPNCVPKCLLDSLVGFEWKGYKGRRGEREIATYIVANATRLENAILKP